MGAPNTRRRFGKFGLFISPVSQQGTLFLRDPAYDCPLMWQYEPNLFRRATQQLAAGDVTQTKLTSCSVISRVQLCEADYKFIEQYIRSSRRLEMMHPPLVRLAKVGHYLPISAIQRYSDS
jgi:hypothetical protein